MRPGPALNRWIALLLAGAIAGAALWVLLLRRPVDPGAELVTLHNATEGHVKVWENTEGYSYLVTELDPGETATVYWMLESSPTYRAEDPNHQTIFCGPAQRGTYGLNAYHQGHPTIEITLLHSISVEVLDRITLCQPPV
jgi:hypothetical protein